MATTKRALTGSIVVRASFLMFGFVPSRSVEVIGEGIRTLEKIDEINIHLNGDNKQGV